ncbi:MAG: ATP-dependent DNA ligase [Candidatus Thermoplasmatota archaeon]|nr:ATP-dependent DNA ligase [Candidatus Thermoplasmatota archaeon]
MLFSKAAEVFEQVSNTSKRTEITKILADLFANSDSDLKSLVYFVQGKLAPDYEGIESGVSDKSIIKVFSSISGRAEEDITGLFHKVGDLGLVAEEIMAEKLQKSLVSTELTVGNLHAKLLEIARSSGSGSNRNRAGLLESILLDASPRESKYICRILTGKLRLGASDITILGALSQAFGYEDSDEVENAYNFHPDIGFIAELLRTKDIDKIKAIGPEPGIPIKVMLAERLPDIPQIMEKMGETVAFEYKYDGIRSQIHKTGEKVVIFSRGTENQTEQFPDIVEAVLETFQGRNCILDGEAVPVNPETGEIYSFQAVSQRRGRKYDLDATIQEIPLVVFLFDILYLDGRSMVNLPYLERRKTLESLFEENQSIKRATQLISGDQDKLALFFEQAIQDGCEGIVAKNVTEKSVYRAGARGWLWIKMKRDYKSELADTLDLVVVGAFAGHGRRKGTYGALLMASYNADMDRFETVCKLGTGFSDEVLFGLPKTLAPFASKEKPAAVESKLKADFWFNPSLVMEIAGAEITLSPVHTCAMGMFRTDSGIAIRFPRFTGRFRHDKSAFDCTTTAEIVEMYNSQGKKTASS